VDTQSVQRNGVEERLFLQSIGKATRERRDRASQPHGREDRGGTNARHVTRKPSKVLDAELMAREQVVFTFSPARLGRKRSRDNITHVNPGKTTAPNKRRQSALRQRQKDLAHTRRHVIVRAKDPRGMKDNSVEPSGDSRFDDAMPSGLRTVIRRLSGIIDQRPRLVEHTLGREGRKRMNRAEMDEPTDAFLQASLGDVADAAHVDLKGLGIRRMERDLGGEVINDLRALHELVHGRRVAYIAEEALAIDALEAAPVFMEQNANVIAALDERTREVRANMTRSPVTTTRMNHASFRPGHEAPGGRTIARDVAL